MEDVAVWLFGVATWLFGVVVGWLGNEFISTPLRTFFGLRRMADSAFFRFGNVSAVYEQGKDPRKHPDWNRFLETQVEFRRIGADLKSFPRTHRLAGVILKALGYDPEGAGGGLFGYSNTFGSPEARRRRELSWHRDQVEKSLKLPRQDPDPQMRD